MNELRNRGLFEGDFETYLVSFILPQWYAAVSIDDFLREKDCIQTTKAYQLSGIALRKSYHGIIGSAWVDFPSVSYNHVSYMVGNISDLTGSLDVGMEKKYGLPEAKRRQLKSGMRLYDATISFCPKDNKIWLIDYNLEGPSIECDSREPETLLKRLRAFSTA